jgi:ubiquinone/menaquinone biosynthesis C-methylase UbiE
VERRYEARSEEEIAELHAFLAEVRERVLDRARIREGDEVVDVGAGTGLLTCGALRRVGVDDDVFAVDVSVDCLEEIRSACPDPRLWCLVGSAEVLPLPDASVDVAVMRSVLIYVRDKAKAARELSRVLRPGGRVSICEPVNRLSTRLWEIVDFGDLEQRVIEDFNRRWPPNHPLHDFDVADMEGWFAAAGFAALDVDVPVTVQTLSADAVLHGVSAPGCPYLVDAWRSSFTADEVERLAGAVRAASPMTTSWPAVYLAAVKP